MIAREQPRNKLLTQPTPLQRLERIEYDLGRDGLFVKRDDHMMLALGGNKVRSLEFWLGEACEEKADLLLVAGAPVSNQCRLTAAAAAVAGLDCIVFHNAEMDKAGESASFLNQVFGATVRFLGAMDEERRALEVARVAEELRRQGRRPYIVGDAVVGALGYVLATDELYRQSRDGGAGLRHVFLPGSMGPTEAGFIFGNALLGHPFEIHLISVEYGQAELRARIKAIYDGLASRTGLRADAFDAACIHYHMDYLGPGYGAPTEACEQAILTFARREGILLEHTYTGKTFAGFLDLLRRRILPQGETACVIHTGGVPTLFSQFDLFKKIGRG